MMKRSQLSKKIGLTLAGLSIAFSGSAFSGMQICTDGGLTVFDPDSDAYWFRIGGRVDLDEILFSGNHIDKDGRFTRGGTRGANFRNSGNIRRAVLALGGGVGENWIYSISFDFGRSFHDREPVLRLLNPSNNITPLTPAQRQLLRLAAQRRRITHGAMFFEEAWLGYTGLWDCSRIRVGQFTPITTLDGYGNYGTTNGQMFLESALATRAFDVPSYINSSSTSMKGFGIIMDTQLSDMFTVAATVYQPAHGADNVYNNRDRSDRLGGALRLTFSPIHEEGCAYHFGLMARYQSLNSSRRGPVRSRAVYNELFFTTPEVVPRNYVGVFESPNPFLTGVPFHSPIGSPILVDAGPFRAKSYNHVAAELAGIWGPITLAGEYHLAAVQRVHHRGRFSRFARGARATDPRFSHRNRTRNVDFYGWHLQGGYVLTGESRDYDFEHGSLGGITPCNYYGAWELVARYSYLTLNDRNVMGGSEHNATLGLNWYVNTNVRFAFNYIRANIHPTNPFRAGFPSRFAQIKRKLDIFALRAQFVF